MAENIQSLGYLLKKEKLATLASDKPHPELLLESLQPYPGFYEEYFLPTNEREQRPKSVFMVIKNFDVCHEDDFIRMTMHIKRDHQIKFDAALSSIVLFNEHATSIRVNMDDYSQLVELITHYKQVGIKFQPARQVKPYQSLIKIRRFFDLELMSDGIFKDKDKPDIYYLRVPLFMTWDEFEKVTISIRNNFDYKTYDAAQAAIYNKEGIIELVRIYDRKADLSKLQSLQQKYIIEVERK
jgi:hypothetical protein